MHRLLPLTAAMFVLAACSDPQCADGETKVGSTCHVLHRSDGGNDGGTGRADTGGDPNARTDALDAGTRSSGDDASAVTAPDAGQDRVVNIAATWDSTCAFTASGATWCWGESFPTEGTIRMRPTLAPELAGADRLWLQNATACARFAGNELRCWGDNEFGTIGDGTQTPRIEPTKVLELGPVVEAAHGAGSACALQAAGGVKCWGSDGIHGIGQLGRGIEGRRFQLIPQAVPGTEDAVEYQSAEFHRCVRTAMGVVRCWGNNEFGQLGDGTRTPRGTPTEVLGLSEITGLRLSVGRSCALHESRQVLCWKHPITTDEMPKVEQPLFVGGINDVVELTVRAHACARLSSGIVSCWGANWVGQLGDGSLVPREEPRQVAGLTGVVQLVAGSSHTCARLESGEVRCWGDNSRGQLGDGTTNARLTPVRVGGLP